MYHMSHVTTHASRDVTMTPVHALNSCSRTRLLFTHSNFAHHPPMPSIIKTLSVGVVLVNRNFQALSNHFVVRTAANAIIDEMKEDLHKKWAEDPSNDPSEFYPVDVLIWRLKDRMVIQNPTPERIKEKLGQIDVKNTKDTMDLLWDEDIVAHLGLLPDEILIAQPPSTSCISAILTPHNQRSPSWRSHYERR